MQILNLSDPNSSEIRFEAFRFNGGEMHIKVYPEGYNEIQIRSRLNNSDDLMLVLLATDALRGAGTNYISLVIPYVPYARQDRRMVDGEPLSIKVLAKIINAQNYDSVEIYDPHSDVTSALIDRVKVVPNYDLLKQLIVREGLTEFTLLAPDAGAAKKTSAAMKYILDLQKNGLIDEGVEIVFQQCNKLRNLHTGAIVYTDIPGRWKDETIVIIDDICDGGGTFIGTLDTLVSQGWVGEAYLIVTHGIFSKGTQPLTDRFKKVYCTNSVSDITDNNNIVQIKII